jgi:hypothetical protein
MLFLALPLILAIVTFFLGFGLGNAGLLFLSAGQLLFVPIAVMGLHIATNILEPFLRNSLSSMGMLTRTYNTWFAINLPYNDIGLLVPSTTLTDTINVWPSYWMAHFTFFSAYILSNASAVYNLEPLSDEAEFDVKVENRKARATNIIIFTIMIFLILSGIRLRFTNSESIFGALFATVAFGILGYGWFIASNSLGIRTMDIFGIVQQMVKTMDPSKPTVCVSN